jgi:RNA polymerase subunit RPABC4/transcription elongation factor Spt4
MSIFDRMKQGASEAARKVEQTVEIQKLKAQISAKDKEMDKLYTRIGQAVFRGYSEGDIAKSEEEVVDYCEELSGLTQDIELIREKIKSIKLEKSCGECGKVVPVGVSYCPDCGKKFPVEEQKPEASMGDIRVICRECKAENEFDARYCVDCGHELSPGALD